MMIQVSRDPVATTVLLGDQARQFMRAVWYNIFLSFTCQRRCVKCSLESSHCLTLHFVKKEFLYTSKQRYCQKKNPNVKEQTKSYHENTIKLGQTRSYHGSKINTSREARSQTTASLFKSPDANIETSGE